MLDFCNNNLNAVAPDDFNSISSILLALYR